MMSHPYPLLEEGWIPAIMVTPPHSVCACPKSGACNSGLSFFDVYYTSMFFFINPQVVFLLELFLSLSFRGLL